MKAIALTTALWGIDYFEYICSVRDLWAYTSNPRILSPLKGNHALESDVSAHKFMRLSLHTKIQRNNLFMPITGL
jgi:hypothetical protein